MGKTQNNMNEVKRSTSQRNSFIELVTRARDDEHKSLELEHDRSEHQDRNTFIFTRLEEESQKLVAEILTHRAQLETCEARLDKLDLGCDVDGFLYFSGSGSSLKPAWRGFVAE